MTKFLNFKEISHHCGAEAGSGDRAGHQPFEESDSWYGQIRNSGQYSYDSTRTVRSVGLIAIGEYLGVNSKVMDIVALAIAHKIQLYYGRTGVELQRHLVGD